MKKNWEANLQSCSLQMMQILSDQCKIDLVEIDKDILKWQEDHKNICSHISFSDRNKTLKEHLIKYATSLIKSKDNTFLRDKKAYDLEQAYQWNQVSRLPRRGGPPSLASPGE